MKITRSASDVCLLCQLQASTKQRSHIVPKFLTKKIFIGGGFQIGSHTKHAARKVQDSAKEDFILCPGCEERFSILETLVANKFYNRFRDPASKNNFPITHYGLYLQGQIDTMELRSMTSGLMRLFVYSIFWRASISTCEIYKEFKLELKIEEMLRQDLDTYLGYKMQEMLTLADTYSAHIRLPYNLLTTLTITPDSGNLINSLQVDGKYLLCANNLAMILYTEQPLPYGGGYNANSRFAEVGLLPVDKWKEFISSLLHFLAHERYKARGLEGLSEL